MQIEIEQEFIKLSQFLKMADLCPTGGMAKYFIKVHKILINDRQPDGRNAKIRVGDTVWVDDNVYQIVAKK
ncbi:RNA-binding S4 domain-containing protein [Mycoplasma phocoeninasale]|uniref:RNA-binding S4 domain-containing protein n=1 Tax=Mycoplasma phocoeninasale TaxID=2726117 RepID=A0A858U1J1_9MOLU|nr:RNA-binding S4 domain-containing protein [Mycoplasma phocoeninasale]MBN0970570.1 RNA-binding S4 domain-containing protein [Mycoplasma phocoeninasale]QJG66310.1 RNA-binding S4 domain-containing protein [Mycoplasma phocoeninasale]